MQKDFELQDRALVLDATEEVKELILSRESTVIFSDEEPSDEVLNDLFESAKWAASSYNEQPWRFILTRKGTEAYEKVYRSLMPANQNWAISAPVLIVSVAKIINSRTGKPNRHAAHDVGLAVGNFSVMATAHGLKLHQMGGFDIAGLKQSFNISEEYDPLAVIALGYPGDIETLGEDLRAREASTRKRKSTDEVVYEGTWKNN